MNTKIIGIIVAAIVVIGGVTLVMNNQKSSDKVMMEKDGAMTKDDKMAVDTMKKDDTMMAKEESTEKDGAMMMKGGYMDYDAKHLAFAEKGKVVLFFKASWCPSCQALDKDINANLSKLPADVLILKVDYDNSSELKKKYSVLGQHTLVQVDKDGNMKSTWRGSATVSELLGEL
jgi:thiol-disulfide isomerase/thioredoxin